MIVRATVSDLMQYVVLVLVSRLQSIVTNGDLRRSQSTSEWREGSSSFTKKLEKRRWNE